MTEQEILLHFMQERGFDFESLAAATGDSRSSIYMITRGGRPVNDAFKWRFAQAFGWEEAERLFGKPIQEPATEPTEEPFGETVREPIHA